MRRSRARSRTALVTLGAGALGAAAEYFLDPVNGRRRRRLTADRSTGVVRRTWRRGVRRARIGAAYTEGWSQRARHLREEPKDFDDATLAAKVETEIFRSPDVPKGLINVNAQHGVVQLRGEVPTPDLIEALVARTRAVHGVREVENLLHLHGTPAPMHQ